jgi:hypothetical protein
MLELKKFKADLNLSSAGRDTGSSILPKARDELWPARAAFTFALRDRQVKQRQGSIYAHWIETAGRSLNASVWGDGGELANFIFLAGGTFGSTTSLKTKGRKKLSHHEPVTNEMEEQTYLNRQPEEAPCALWQTSHSKFWRPFWQANVYNTKG